MIMNENALLDVFCNKPQVKIAHTQPIRRLLYRNPKGVNQICWCVLAKMKAAALRNYCMQDREETQERKMSALP